MSSISPTTGWNRIDFGISTPSHFGQIHVRYSERDSTLHLRFSKTRYFLLAPEAIKNRTAQITGELALYRQMVTISRRISNAKNYSSGVEIIQSRLTTIHKIAVLVFKNI